MAWREVLQIPRRKIGSALELRETQRVGGGWVTNMMGISLNRAALLAVLLLTVAVLGTGCSTTMPKPSGFLSTYTNLVKYDDSTWRYANAPQLATYDKFVISSIKVLVKKYDGDPLPPGDQEAASTHFREIIEKKMAGHWQLLTKPNGHTADIRAAITSVYPVGSALALGMEGEIVDAYSGKQLAAVVTYEVGPPQIQPGEPNLCFNDALYGGWWNTETALWLMERWADQFVKALEKIDSSDKTPAGSK